MNSPTRRLNWIDPLKGITLIWIFLNHASERMLGGPYFGNPGLDWPGLGERIAQARPIGGLGIWTIPVNLFRYIGWTGDQGVGLFLLLSGFGLAWGCLSRDDNSPTSTGKFYRRRLIRIYPLWIAAHLVLLVPLAVFGWHFSLLNSQLYFSMLGIRILPNQMYYGVPAWWYIPMLIQLYLLFPLLWNMMRRWGPSRFFIIICFVALPIRCVGLFYFSDYLDAWSRGAICITRLPEFALGMAAAGWVWRKSSDGDQRGVSHAMLALLGAAAWAAGVALSFTLVGMTVAPLLESGGAFAVLYAIFARQTSTNDQQWNLLDWIGRHSFSLYLAHQPLVSRFLPAFGAVMNPRRILVGGIVAIGASVVLALLLEKIVECADKLWQWGENRWGVFGTGWRIAGVGLTAWVLLIAGDVVVRHVDPVEPEDLGWGERPLMQASDEFGWNLKPDQKTHLRWKSYDYTVTANHLGFPGPDVPLEKPAGTFRIMVTGDAFTSAEGVDTDSSWPRLLEKNLAENSPALQPQVMDFAITGYGPNQYFAVVNYFAPLYHPDLILIGLFINDYGDVMTSDDEFRDSIGFGLPDPNGLAAYLSFRQLAGWSREVLMRNLAQRVRHRPDPDGYFLGQFRFLERDCPEIISEGRQRLAVRIAQIKQIADGLGIRVMIVMIPSGPQVCPPEKLAYWPKYVDLSDEKFDPDQPQRVTSEIAASLDIPCYDLRPALRAVTDECPYQSHNMHWTAAGHRAASDFVSRTLRDTGAFPRSVLTLR